VTRELDRSLVDQRADVARLSQTLRKDLETKGTKFIEVDREGFRRALAKTSAYHD